MSSCIQPSAAAQAHERGYLRIDIFSLKFAVYNNPETQHRDHNDTIIVNFYGAAGDAARAALPVMHWERLCVGDPRHCWHGRLYVTQPWHRAGTLWPSCVRGEGGVSLSNAYYFWRTHLLRCAKNARVPGLLWRLIINFVPQLYTQPWSRRSQAPAPMWVGERFKPYNNSALKIKEKNVEGGSAVLRRIYSRLELGINFSSAARTCR